MKSAVQSLASAFLMAPLATLAALSDPPINGSIVADRVSPYAFDICFVPRGGPAPPCNIGGAQGMVHSSVIAAPDGTFDFLFHVTATTRPLSEFRFEWTTPTTFSIPYFAYDAPFPDGEMMAFRFPEPAPTPGRSVGFEFESFDPSGITESEGRLLEAVLLLDTDARGFSQSGGYTLSLEANGVVPASSGRIAALAPIPEPQTYALMLCGLAALAGAVRRRRRLP